MQSKYKLGYAGYGSTLAKMRAGSSTKSVQLGMSPECLDIKTDKGSDLSSVESRESDESYQSQEEVRYYNDDPQFPMLSTARRKFEAGEVLHVVSKDSANDMKCQCQPMQVQRNAVFLIESRFVPFDDNGQMATGPMFAKGVRHISIDRRQTVNGKREVQNVQKS